MKSMAKAVVIGTLVIAAQGALADSSAFPAEAPEFIGLRANVTYASQHANDRMTTAQSAIPNEDPEFIGLSAKDTYASHHENDAMTTAQSVFPSEDPEFIGLPAKDTYASHHLSDRVATDSQPGQQETTGN